MSEDDDPDLESNAKWQPVMVYVRRGGRVECGCGAIAVIVVGTIGDSYNQLDDVETWCQTCYIKAQQEEMERQ